MSRFYNDAIFWVEVDKIKPNPYQPRREFDEAQLKSLADSIRQYGMLQALVVTRNEVIREDGGIGVEYELVAGERRLRAARLASLAQVPVLIRTGEESDLMKLELAIIENLQREDLNAVDRARAFDRLAQEFNLTHQAIGKKVGKSREYVSNTLRILMLPEYMLNSLSEGKISEGHTRPLMMLVDRPEEQETLFKEIIFKRLNVREAEQIARNIAIERTRKLVDQELIDIEEQLKEKLGTRVRIERRDEGGQVKIDFFNKDDLRAILEMIVTNNESQAVENIPALTEEQRILAEDEPVKSDPRYAKGSDEASNDESLYSVTNFSI
ncbi:MAG: ParB/RepB/Spo0J family partition protein [Candidatus Zambryskibacteria bacterium]|nr:ParB/RepB/Spo0J family partition protein [Candidatus Zambryskibacteria bacterium]